MIGLSKVSAEMLGCLLSIALPFNVSDWFVESERGNVWLFAKHSATA